jgi:hypothetical protein
MVQRSLYLVDSHTYIFNEIPGRRIIVTSPGSVGKMSGQKSNLHCYGNLS